MANHCIDVICLDCGRAWCTRGCNYRAGPSQARIDWFRADRASWSKKFNKPWPMDPSGDRCECGSKNVTMK